MREQKLVEDFHRALNVTVGSTPAIREGELRISLLQEEVNETIRAIRDNDIVEAADGLCDILYVVLGTAITFGINLEPLFDEVHRTNMAKTTGPVREDGKRLKPAGWQPPRIKELLDEQM